MGEERIGPWDVWASRGDGRADSNPHRRGNWGRPSRNQMGKVNVVVLAGVVGGYGSNGEVTCGVAVRDGGYVGWSQLGTYI